LPFSFRIVKYKSFLNFSSSFSCISKVSNGHAGQLSLLNIETNKVLIINTTHISTKLFSTLSSKEKPTWRITYNEEEEDSENNDIYSNHKSFGNVNISNTSPKNKFTMNSSNSKSSTFQKSKIKI